MKEKLNSFAFGTAAAIVAAFSMLVLSVAGKLGIYLGAVEMMSKWHMFYSLSTLGIFTGMFEAAIISFVFFYLFAWIYTNLAKRA